VTTTCIPCLQHDDAEGNSGNPGYEAYDGEDREEEENDSARIVFSRQHVDSCRETSNDVNNASDPDELLTCVSI
jgi:hypothetical protein